MDERRLPAASSEEVRSADIEVERMCFGIVGLFEAALGYVDETVLEGEEYLPARRDLNAYRIVQTEVEPFV